MGLRRKRRFSSRLDVDECQRRVWLLNGQPLKPKSTHVVIAHAGETGFRMWSVGSIPSARGTNESPLALHGRWIASGEGTGVAIWYSPRPWYRWAAGLVLAGLALLALFRMVWRDAFHYLTGDAAGLIIFGLLIGLAFTGVIAASQLFRDDLGQMLEMHLGMQSEPIPPVRSRPPSRRRKRTNASSSNR